MVHKVIVRTAFAVLAFATVASGAMAQDNAPDQGYFASDDPDATVADDGGVYVDASPRVYGWVARPANCGTFRYWNGLRCVDKRFEPLE